MTSVGNHGKGKSKMKIINYDTNRYYFADLVGSLYDTSLDQLDNEDQKTNLIEGSDTKTAFHKKFYERIDADGGWPEFINLYQAFVREVIFPMFEDDELLYQKYPGIRFCRPGAKAVYRWHSDGDSHHRHPLGEVNIFLPLTKCFGNNSVWVESIPGLGDFSPLEMEYGQFMMGYWNQCRHGNKDNDSGVTRVSFDFRVMPSFAYNPESQMASCTTKQKFIIGEYYDVMDREETPETFDPVANAMLGSAC
jgi:hypothetical protein